MLKRDYEIVFYLYKVFNDKTNIHYIVNTPIYILHVQFQFIMLHLSWNFFDTTPELKYKVVVSFRLK